MTQGDVLKESANDRQTVGKVYSCPSLIKSDHEVARHKSLGNYLLNKMKGDQADVVVFVSRRVMQSEGVQSNSGNDQRLTHSIHRLISTQAGPGLGLSCMKK